MAEGARLESVYTATYRGFESLPHRQIKEKSPVARQGSFLLSGSQWSVRTLVGSTKWQDSHFGLPQAARKGEHQGRCESIPTGMLIPPQDRALFFYLVVSGW